MALNIFLSFLLAIGTIGAVFVLCTVGNKLHDKLMSHFMEKGLSLYDARESASGVFVMTFLLLALTGAFYIILTK